MNWPITAKRAVESRARMYNLTTPLTRHVSWLASWDESFHEVLKPMFYKNWQKLHLTVASHILISPVSWVPEAHPWVHYISLYGMSRMSVYESLKNKGVKRYTYCFFFFWPFKCQGTERKIVNVASQVLSKNLLIFPLFWFKAAYVSFYTLYSLSY